MTSEGHHDAHSGVSGSEQEEFSESVMEVSRAEAQAKKLVLKAEEDRVERIAAARKKAVEIAAQAEVAAEEKREAMVEAERRKIEGETASILKAAREKAAELKKKPFKQLAQRLARELLPKK